jgi:hypothetical protein
LLAASGAALLRRKRLSTAAKTTHAANGGAVEAAVIVSVININAHRIEMLLSFDKGVGALAVSDQKKVVRARRHVHCITQHHADGV